MLTAPLAALLLAGCDPAAAPAGTPGSPPNVVLILADDLGWSDTGIYGSRFYETPHIDALARAGVRFTNAYAASPLCSPTRAALVTGLTPERLRFTSPLGHVPEVVLDPSMPTQAPAGQPAIEAPSRTRLPLESYTLAEAFRDSGYATAFFGKWHLGDGDYLPSAQGFDVATPPTSLPSPNSYFSPYRIPGFPDGPEGEHIDERLAGEAVEFMRRHRDEPFFVSFWPFSVHVPTVARPELVEKYRRLADPASPQRNPQMGAMIETLDGCVGSVLAALAELGLEERTILIFSSDNGGLHISFGRPTRTAPVTSNLPLRGGKGQLYEGGIRVPLIVRWPGRFEAGLVSDELVTSTDLYPTLLELAGIAPKPDLPLDGISIVAALRQQSLPRDALFAHLPVYMLENLSPPATSVRKGDWKLIRFYAEGLRQQNRHELYNLARDLGESRNLAPWLRDRVAELDGLIDAHLAATSALVPVPNPNYDPRRRKPRSRSAR